MLDNDNNTQFKKIKPCEIFLNQENKIKVEKEDSHSSKVEKCGGSFKTTKSLRGTWIVYMCVYQQDRSLSNDITSFTIISTECDKSQTHRQWPDQSHDPH